LGLTLSVLALTAGLVPGAVAQGPPPALVVTKPIVQRDVAPDATFVGTVMPSQKSIVGCAVDGRVVEYLVDEGDPVAKGDPLVRLRTKTLDIELAAAVAQEALRRHEFEELDNGTRPEEKAQARARMLGAEAHMQYTKAAYRRAEALFRQDRAVSQEELDQTRSAAVVAEQALLEAKAAYALAEAGPRKEKIAQAGARLAAQAEEVKRLKDLLDEHTIRSPLDGFVVAEHTEEGEWVAKGDPVAEIVDVDPVEIRMLVPEGHIDPLRTGMPVRVSLGALPNEVFPGAEVTRIVPQADVRSRTFPVIIKLPNPKRGGRHLVKPGMLAHVTVAIGVPRPALLVDKDALVLGGPKPVVFVVDAGPKGSNQGTVRPVPVKTGVAKDGLIQVSGSVKVGQEVVVEGNERLRPGQAVRVKKK